MDETVQEGKQALSGIKKAGGYALKIGGWALACTAVFGAASAAIAATPALGAGIAAGKVGLGQLSLESIKLYATEFVPGAWGAFPESMSALSNSVSSGASWVAGLTA